MATESSRNLPSWQTSIPMIHNLEHSQAMRVVWALQELQDARGLHFEIKNYPRVRPKNPDLLQISPLGKSPILTVKTLDGKPLPNLQVRDGVIMESKVIIQWLADTYDPKNELGWIPEDESDRRRDAYFQEFAVASLVERVDFVMLFEVMSALMPFPLGFVLGLIFKPLVKIFKGFLPDYFDFMESELSEERPWFAGRRLGLADFAVEFPMTMAVTRGYVDEKKYPKIQKWYAALTARPSWQKAIQKGGGKEKYDLVRFGQL